MAIRQVSTVVLLFSFPVSLAPQNVGEPVHFESHGSMLQGLLFRTPDAAAPGVILLHGWQSGEGDVLGLGEALSQEGWNVLAFNFRGVYESEGRYSLANCIEDAGAAAKFMRSPAALVGEGLPIAVVGWSHGGWVALMAGAREPGIDCVVSLAAANMGVFARQIEESPEARESWENRLDRTTSGSPARGSGGKAEVQDILDHRVEYDPITHTPALAQKPLLVIGGWKDPVITIEDFVLPLVRALQASGGQKFRPLLFDDYHGFQNSRSELHEAVADWLNAQCLQRSGGAVRGPFR